jgi:hypothetical protein
MQHGVDTAEELPSFVLLSPSKFCFQPIDYQKSWSQSVAIE